MRLLDTFCGAGGAAMGYSRAGFEVVGVDRLPQPRFPFEFIQANAIEYIETYGGRYDVIHASPPCQGYSKTRYIHGCEYPMLVDIVRESLKATGRPYIIEMVTAGPLQGNVIMLCGAMFGLGVIRHRYFETSAFILAPSHPRHERGRTAKRGEYDRGQRGYITVSGHNFSRAVAGEAMGIDWMIQGELAQAIPPAYTEWLGGRILSQRQRPLTTPVSVVQ